MTAPIVEVEDLHVRFWSRAVVRSDEAPEPAVRGVTFRVMPGEAACLIGQSGCGKTATVRAMVAIVDGRPGVVRGRVTWHTRDGRAVRLYDAHDPEGLTAAASARRALIRERDAARAMAPLRGREVHVVFQNSQTSLSPYWSVGRALTETLRQSGDRATGKALGERVVDLLAQVGFTRPAAVTERLPCELSGGEAKRVAIAQALASSARLVVADEPTTGLDPTLRVVVRDLFLRLKAQGRTLLVITHGIGLFRELVDTVHVMSAGALVESAPTSEFLGAVGPQSEHGVHLLRAEAWI